MVKALFLNRGLNRGVCCEVISWGSYRTEFSSG